MRKYATRSIIVAGVLAAGCLTKAAAAPDSEKVSKLLSEAKTLAFQVKEDAATMESFTYMNVSVESQKVAINQIKNDVNALGRQVDKLKSARSEASPWQQTAIDRITPFLDELGGYTDAVLEHLKGTERRDFAEYKDFLEANADYSADLAAMIAEFVDYGNAKARVERLGTKLEIRPAK
jgi:outer membrane murein-binding lipoprotein Lpp